MGALAPLSFQTLESWARVTDLGNLEPYEVEALLEMDAALLNPDAAVDEDEEPQEQVKVERAWPVSTTAPVLLPG